jgi:hypothetical protein
VLSPKSSSFRLTVSRPSIGPFIKQTSIAYYGSDDQHAEQVIPGCLLQTEENGFSLGQIQLIRSHPLVFALLLLRLRMALEAALSFQRI